MQRSPSWDTVDPSGSSSTPPPPETLCHRGQADDGTPTTRSESASTSGSYVPPPSAPKPVPDGPTADPEAKDDSIAPGAGWQGSDPGSRFAAHQSPHPRSPKWIWGSARSAPILLSGLNRVENRAPRGSPPDAPFIVGCHHRFVGMSLAAPGVMRPLRRGVLRGWMRGSVPSIMAHKSGKVSRASWIVFPSPRRGG